MKDDLLDSARVVAISSVGFVTSLTLAEAASLTSIAVGLATFVYVVTKTVLLIRGKGNPPKSLD